MDIFEEKRLYPGFDTPIKKHYKNHYNTVFIAFSPFFKMRSEDFAPDGQQKSREITFEEAQEKHEILKSISKSTAQIYSYDNGSYPNDDEIYRKANKVTWNDIKKDCDFTSPADINKALKTSIGGYRKVFQRPDLAERLLAFTEANQIYYPTERHFEVLSKKSIFKAFKLKNKNELIIEEEHSLSKKIIDITSLTEEQFVKSVDFKDYFIYDVDKELLFAVDWDDFFFLICSNKDTIDILTKTLDFEGFYCSDTTESSWELTRAEIESCLEQERKEKELEKRTNSTENKPWWKVW